MGWGWNGVLEGGMNLGMQEGGTQAWWGCGSSMKGKWCAWDGVKVHWERIKRWNVWGEWGGRKCDGMSGNSMWVRAWSSNTTCKVSSFHVGD